MFTSASALKSGSSVEIAGVEVGTVSDVSLNRDNQAVLKFTVADKYSVPKSVKALIRYENLTGDRYLELRREPGAAGPRLADGARIPVEQTQPALDLDNPSAGSPLLRSLNPDEANQLTASLIEVFQGQGPALTHLLKEHRPVHRFAGRPRSADRRRDRQPEHDDRHRRGRQEGL